jgi:hypothetical protein
MAKRLIGTSVLIPAKVYRAFAASARARGVPVGTVFREGIVQFERDVAAARRRKKTLPARKRRR